MPNTYLECVYKNAYGVDQHCYLSSAHVIFFTHCFLDISECELFRAGNVSFLTFGKFFIPCNRFCITMYILKIKEECHIAFLSWCSKACVKFIGDH